MSAGPVKVVPNYCNRPGFSVVVLGRAVGLYYMKATAESQATNWRRRLNKYVAAQKESGPCVWHPSCCSKPGRHEGDCEDAFDRPHL